MRISLFCYCILARSRSLYAVASPSVICLSVTLMRPSQAVEIFGQFFYVVWYLGHPLTSTENFTDIVPVPILYSFSVTFWVRVRFGLRLGLGL